MAKTRIKTTPTRMQKEALMASEVVSTTTNIVTEHVLKKRLSVLKSCVAVKEKPLPIPTTIIVQPPKRTNSISSTTSTISHTSDGSHSCTDSPPPSNISESGPTQNNGPTMDELTANAIKTLNAGFLAKSNARLLKNRKVYMITEKCDDAAANAVHNSESKSAGENGMATGQKRKMFLIMEEDENDKNNEKQVKVESFAPKKLTLYTNTSDGQLPQEFEKVLPDLLNRIQSNKGVKKVVEACKANSEIVEATESKAGQLSLLKTNNTKVQMKTETPERLPLTLPPKKNRTKIITTQIIPVNPNQPLPACPANCVENWAATNSAVVASSITAPSLVAPHNIMTNGFYKTEKSSGATPVIVNASTLLATNGNANIAANGFKSKENCSNNKATTVNQLHKNINLSTDFLFLMKMLPKLESIEEPNKNYVKTYIEDIINQYAPHQIEQQ